MDPSSKPTAIALFRYQIIASLLSIDGARGDQRRAITTLCARTHTHPTKGPIQIGRGTIEEWLYRYRKDGLDGLEDRPRRDLGRSRKIDAELAEQIVDLAKARPQLDGPGLLAELQATQPEASRLPSLSTLYRFLRSRGLDQRRAPTHRDHRAFEFDLAGDCWQGDVMYRPSIAVRSGQRRTVYLIAILDDATRMIVHAQFYLEQHLRSLKDCLKQAMLKRGVPRRFYFDNGKIFRSRILLALCARLGIQLIHTRPYQPQGRAKLERWFLTVRKSFLARVDIDRIDDVDALNRLLFAWIEGVYHQRRHRGIGGETPLDRWLRLSDGVRPVPLDVDLDELFLDDAVRRVGKDGTLSLSGKKFEVGPRLIGQKVQVRFDPLDLRRVWATGANGEAVTAFPVDLTANRYVRRLQADATATVEPRPLRSLDVLARDVESGANPTHDQQSQENDHGR